MKNKSVYDRVLDQYNKEQQTAIRIEEDRLCPLLPVVDAESQTVTVSPHLEDLLMLFNIYSLCPKSGSKALHHFLLYHLAMRKNAYAKAEELLRLLRADLEETRQQADNSICLPDMVIECQIIFILMHEASHIFYHHHPDMLAANCRTMKDNLIWLRRQLDTDRPMLVRLLHLLVPGMRGKMEHSFDEAKSDAALQEELLCDDSAWRIAFNLICQNTTDPDFKAILGGYTVLSLYCLEAQRTLEKIYLTSGNLERQRHLAFDTTRSTMLTNTVWDDVEPSAIRHFTSLVNRISRSGRLALMLTLCDNIEHIGYIRNMPRERYSKTESIRIREMYGNVIRNLYGEQ